MILFPHSANFHADSIRCRCPYPVGTTQTASCRSPSSSQRKSRLFKPPSDTLTAELCERSRALPERPPNTGAVGWGALRPYGRAVTIDTGPGVDTVAGLMGASAPSAPIVYCETVLSPMFAT
jgi:hypothetical protein